jgi:hypothetical protein
MPEGRPCKRASLQGFDIQLTDDFVNQFLWKGHGGGPMKTKKMRGYGGV